MNDSQATAQDSLLDSLLGDFLDESDQLLTQLNKNLLQLDEWVRSLDEGHQESCDAELLNDGLGPHQRSLLSAQRLYQFGSEVILVNIGDQDQIRRGELRVSFGFPDRVDVNSQLRCLHHETGVAHRYE